MSAEPQPQEPDALALDEEAALIERCRQGDRAALQVVLTSHAQSLERQIVRLLGPQPEVADVLQNTLITAVRAFSNFRGEAKLSTWLTGIAINVVRDHLKRPERRRLLALAALPEAADDSSDPERQYLQRSALGRVRLALTNLPINNRLAFILHVVEGRPIEEVAALCSASITATKSRIFLARRSLKRALRDGARSPAEGRR